MTGKPNITEELEALIDATSLLDVLTGLELICVEKAEHVRVNWQDRALAKLWDRASIVCGKAARHADVQDVS
jgi:hypothetical protein